MRVQSALVLGLSLFTGFTTAEVPASNNNAVLVERKLGNSRFFRHARDAVVSSLHEVNERGVSRTSKVVPKPTTHAAAPVKPTTHAAAPVKPTTHAAAPAKPTTHAAAPAKPTTHSVAQVKPITHSAAQVKTTTGVAAKPTTHAAASGKPTLTSKVSSAHATGTKTSASAAATSGAQRLRVLCGQAGSTCSGNSCSSHSAHKRAYIDPDGVPEDLSGKGGNVDLSNPSLRDMWIPFEDQPKSVTINGLVGCTSVVAISKKGVYAFHLWEKDTTGHNQDLTPQNYKQTLADVKSKLASKAADLDGGQLFVMLPLNPENDQLYSYDSTWFKKDGTGETYDAPKPGDPNAADTHFPRVQAIKDAITQGSGLMITEELHYVEPASTDSDDEEPMEVVPDWMTAQFDPNAGDGMHQYGVWASGYEMAIIQKMFTPATADESS